MASKTKDEQKTGTLKTKRYKESDNFYQEILGEGIGLPKYNIKYNEETHELFTSMSMVVHAPPSS